MISLYTIISALSILNRVRVEIFFRAEIEIAREVIPERQIQNMQQVAGIIAMLPTLLQKLKNALGNHRGAFSSIVPVVFVLLNQTVLDNGMVEVKPAFEPVHLRYVFICICYRRKMRYHIAVSSENIRSK